MLECPFVAFESYTDEASEIFSGRDYDCRVVSDSLMSSPVTILYGPSGVGKSSLLRAGVVPRLRRVADEELRTTGRLPFVIVFQDSWAGDPLDSLEQAILEATRKAGVEIGTGGTLPEKLLQFSRDSNVRILIIFDQFEESFVAPEAGPDSEFGRTFPVTMDAPLIHASYLISIRDDSLANLDSHQAEVPRLLDNGIRLPPMTAEDLKGALEETLAKFALEHTDVRPRGYEPGLLDAVIEQLDPRKMGVPVSDWRAAPVEATYVQLVLLKLWEEDQGKSEVLRRSTLQKFENAQEVIRLYVDGKMADIGEKDVAARVLQYLVLPSGAKVHFSSGDLRAVGGIPEKDEGKIEPVLEDMTRMKLLSKADGRDGTARYSLRHDALHFALRGWRDRRLSQRKQELEAEQKEAAERAGEERRNAERLRADLDDALRQVTAVRNEGRRTLRTAMASELAVWALYWLREDPGLSATLVLYSIAATDSIGDRPCAAALDCLDRCVLQMGPYGGGNLSPKAEFGSLDGRVEAEASPEGGVVVRWGKREKRLRNADGSFAGLRFSHDKQRLAGAKAGDHSGDWSEIYLWDWAADDLLFRTSGDPKKIRNIDLPYEGLKERVRLLCRELSGEERAKYLREEDLQIATRKTTAPKDREDEEVANAGALEVPQTYTDEEAEIAREI